MPDKRKDNKGRVLKDGESQRSNGTYQYRYRDVNNNRRYVYAPTLNELRKKESEIARDLVDGIDYRAGEMTVADLSTMYVDQKHNLRTNSKRSYNYVISILGKYRFSNRATRSVKPSDAKAFFIKLHDDSYSYNTIMQVRKLLKAAFDMAVEDDRIRKNPFNFPLSDILTNDVSERMALTDTQLQNFLEFVRSGKYYKHYDELVILSGTGLRVSEMCGLTLQDVDFINNRICVNKQLLMDNNGNYYIEKPKTSISNRYIPMSPSVRQAFQRTIQSRNNPRVEHMINGVTGFVFLTRNKTPKVAEHIRDSLRTILRVYNKTHTEPLCITPHVFRHTFITNMLAA